MDWIETPTFDYADKLALLNKLDKFTLYDHNYFTKVNPSTLTFSCVFNCKRLNRYDSIIGKIEGDLISRNVQINCSLIGFTRLFTAKWHNQKIELTKFANTYNQKELLTKPGRGENWSNYQIKVNPLSG